MKPYGDQRGKKEQVEAMFDNIAPAYDRLNDIMSFGVARAWRRAAVRRVRRTVAGHGIENGAAQILDLATGTGDMAVKMALKMPGAHITGADLSEGMLALARHKAEKTGCSGRVEFHKAEAEQLPFSDGEFDAVTVAFGVRNFGDIPQGLREIQRVLRPGGRVFILEFSTPRGKIFGGAYRFYFHRVLPLIGGGISSDRAAYSYLPGSVEEFPAPERFVQMMEEAGFSQCRAEKFTGGVAYIYSGVKP